MTRSAEYVAEMYARIHESLASPVPNTRVDGIDLAYDESGSEMGWYGGQGVQEKITDMVVRDPSPAVRIAALACVRSEISGAVLLQLAQNDPDREVRRAALLAFLDTRGYRSPEVAPEVLLTILRNQADAPRRRPSEWRSGQSADLVAYCVSAGAMEFLPVLKKMLAKVVSWDWGSLQHGLDDFHNEHPQDWVRVALNGLVENWDRLSSGDRRWTKRFLKRLVKADSKYANYKTYGKDCISALGLG